MKIIKRINSLLYQNIILRVAIGIILIIFIAIVWNSSLLACSSGHPNIRIMYELEDDFYG